MKNMKKMIIVIAICIAIVAIALLILLQYAKSNENDPSKEIFEVGHETTEEVNRTYTKLTLTNDYFRVKEIVDRYYSNIATMNGEGEEIIEYEVEDEEYGAEGMNLQTYKKQEQEQAQKALYAMLGNEYIQEFQITQSNLKEKLSQDVSEEILLKNIYILENS